MRPRPLLWLLISALCFAGAYYFWRLGDRQAAQRAANLAPHAATATARPQTHGASISPFQLLSAAGNLNAPHNIVTVTNKTSHLTNNPVLRLSNTSASLSELQRSERAILLENALLDTAQAAPSIPEQLRAHGDPGAWLVQARGPIDNAFRAVLREAGASIVSYIPNNAYLVRASASVAEQLRAGPRTQSVLPYEPYYKLKTSLLKLAVAQEALPAHSALNVLLFADGSDATRADLQKLGAAIVGSEEPSPFGPVLRVIPPADGLPALAGLPGVQEVEWVMPRVSANDYSRQRIGVATDPLTTSNYLGLSGTNVLVNLNDTGVDANHPDLVNRVFAADTNLLVDYNGHGTHVAGTIAGDGTQSLSVSNAAGPQGPYSGTNGQFRGMAPAASLYVLPVGMMTGPFAVGETFSFPSDSYLQQTAAQTNAFISNNSWNYVGLDAASYDIHAASYDAAVRDALPTVPGSQPLLYVFSAGNAGNGNDDGTQGSPDTIESPATAKNVITVGAIEQLRNITNDVWKCHPPDSTNSCSTNKPWLPETDSTDQVAAFSSRGPVGRNIEGQFGRFKPDLVAPGVFVISAKASMWDTNAYYNPTSHIYYPFPDVFLPTNMLYLDYIPVPDNAVGLSIGLYPNTNSPVPFPDLYIYANPNDYPTNTDLVLGTNYVSIPPATALNPVGVNWYYGISNTYSQVVVCDLWIDIAVTNDLGNYLGVLQGMNDSLGPYYRYETGTSMAAADVSGTLALMQEFFEQRMGRTNSPALMKALLINGARSFNNHYDFNVTGGATAGGWGLVNLPTTIPGALTNGSAATNDIFLIDQDPTNALATGQSRTFKVSLSPDAQGQPLRVTLVWTDPPGNPIASVKLVNDLDLIVTNLDNTNDIYFGNDIGQQQWFNRAWDTNSPPNVDSVNNVENVYLTPSYGINSQLSTNYSITVVGRRVNVNAVTAQTSNVCQDYALVISSGDGLLTNAISLDASAGIVSAGQPLVTAITNSFANSPGYEGGILWNQRVGANPQLLGTNTLAITNDANAVLTLGVTNQWHFYTITNSYSYTNAAFLTFLPVELAVPRMGLFEPNATLATRPQADIDLYVAPPTIPNNWALTNLDTNVLDAATKSLSRGGTETIVYSNAAPGLYYVGVKSEDQMAAQYALLGVFSQNPFGSSDSNGVHLVGIPTMQPIPDAESTKLPGVATIIAPCVESIQVRRVIVTNILNHELISDLIGGFSHGSDYTILNNHSCVIDSSIGSCYRWTSYIYDDSSERDVGPDPTLINPRVTHTDGVNTSLGVFGGKEGQGQWMLSMVDNAHYHVGTNVFLGIFLERQQDLTGQGITVILQGNACRDDFIDVPVNATSLSVTVAVVSASGPIDYTVEVCPANGTICKSTEVTNALGGYVVVDQTDIPPLASGTTYRIRTCNLTPQAITLNIRATFGFSTTTIIPILSNTATNPVDLLDDAVTDIYLTNRTHSIISSVDVGLLIRDPRISDLAITLISPNGTRVLLFENRGAASTNGLGTFALTTNYLWETFFTNNFDAAPVGLYAPGATFQGWNVLSNYVDVLDDFTCLCLSNHILALFDGAVSNSLPTTNSLIASNSVPYILSYKVNHLPWLEGMVTWWPLDIDGRDIFGGFDGLLLGDVAFSTGGTAQFLDDCSGPALNPMWRASLPNAGTGGVAVPIETYAGAPDYTFTTVDATNNVMRLSNRLSPLQRKGWSSATTFQGQAFRYEVRFNTLVQGPPFSTGGFIELWVLDAANSNRFDVVSLFAGDYGTNTQSLLAGSSIDGYNTLPISYQTNTWYRLVLSADPNQGVRAAFLSDDGAQLAAVSFTHGLAAFSSGYKVGLSQFVATPTNAQPVDVAIDWVQVTSGLAGEVSQAYYGDGVATRMVVPRCAELDLGQGRGFSIEGWINPSGSVLIPGATVMTNGFENQAVWYSVPTGATISGWHVDAGTVDLVSYVGSGSLPIDYVQTDSGTNCLDINGEGPGTISTNLTLVAGRSYRLSLAYTRNGDSTAAGVVPQAAISVNGTNLLTLTPNWANSWTDMRWQHTSVVFTAAAPATTLTVQGINTTGYGVMFDSFSLVELLSPPAPLVEWYNPAPPTNQTPQGVQFWLSGLPTTNGVAGSLWANIWDTNGQPHIVATYTNSITNGGWQHVALTYETNGANAILYTNGYPAAVVQFPTNFVPLTSGDIYLGYHVPGLPKGAVYSGGLDEFSLYQRSLTPCEVLAIYNAGGRGKYGTNVLVCPVVTEVTLSNTPAGIQVFTFTNGVSWVTNGPSWETNTILFSSSTNPTPIVVRGLNPYADTNAPCNLNAVVDDFVLSELVPQTIDGLLHFTEDTNLATIPIKFAPAPYTTSNFPPVLVFTNDFRASTAAVYQAGATIRGEDNGPLIGQRDWTVASGPLTVVSNAFLDTVTTNWVALATGTVECQLPTIPGHRYQLSYNLRGPCAVGWWNGSVDPLSQRAQDLISGNNGAFYDGATNTVAAWYGDTYQTYVGPGGLFFNGQTEPPPELDPDIWPEDVDDPASKIELGDPPQLQFTNAFTIEGWIKPLLPTNETMCGTELIFFRGYPEPYDCRGLGDPYWLALEPALDGDPLHRELHFHIANAHTNTLGADVITTNSPIIFNGGTNNGWWHIAAVFDKPWTNITVVSNATNFVTFSTNALRLYLNGVLVASNYTTLSPYKDLDPGLSPGATIGDRSRYDWTQPFYGYIDELTLYARCLTEAEIYAIAAARTAGKADTTVAPAQSLAKLRVYLNGVPMDTANGDNSQWSTNLFEFTALETNSVVALQSLLPGTLVDSIALTEVPAELFYLPEVSLADLEGQDGYGIWTLEIWDNRAGPVGTNLAQLAQWDLNLHLAPSNPPPVITLSHAIPYTNSLPAYGIQYFVVPVPQWANFATNILEFAEQVHTSNALPVTVLFNPTNFPTIADYPLVGPVSAGSTTLRTNSTPALTNGQPYYLALTNPNPVGVTFALGVDFDITTLDNCQMLLSNAVSVAGIPRYFQFDVPTYPTPPGMPPQAVSFWVSSTQCNLKVVLSEHLPLPDLSHYDYTCQMPCTNDQVIMLVTNSTPFPIQTNRWYAGVFNTGFTNTYFNVQACFATNYPVIIPLTNGVPFVVAFTNSPYASPPGPPQQFFFDFLINDAEAGALFELYNLSGNADLVLQQAGPPTMPPYFASSEFPGTNAEQLVLRNTPLVPSDVPVADLRGHWYLGVYNNERTNVTYTIRATLPNDQGLLISGQPLKWSFSPIPQGWRETWNTVIGERYIIQYTDYTFPLSWTNVGTVIATTPLTSYDILGPVGTYIPVQVFSFQPRLAIDRYGTNQVRISWSTAYPGFTLQFVPDLSSTNWHNAIPPATVPVVFLNRYVVYDALGPVSKYYRLIK
jgi:subtilisin-like proprotein convertase family protein